MLISTSIAMVPWVALFASIARLLLLSGVCRVLEVGVSSDDGGRLRGMTGLPHVLWFCCGWRHRARGRRRRPRPPKAPACLITRA